jgi:hypothetical protein
MDSIKGWVTGTVITILIGGTVYTFSQEDVINNFAEDTGLTREQAELYVSEIPEEELETFSVIGEELIDEGDDILSAADEIDCENFMYDWESTTLSCTEGKNQLNKLAEDTRSLGYAYKKMELDSATESDISEAIKLIDQLNADLRMEMPSNLWDWSVLDEEIKTHSYNKSILKAVLERE